jgi:Rieske Fe-S protein
MSTFTSSRREFLRNALSLVVISTTTPLVVLGRVIPNVEKLATGEVVASYIIRLSDFPKLANVGDSVKLTTPEQLALNPDHVRRSFTGRDFPIAVTRVAESGADAFKAVSTYCTHGADYQVGDYNPVKGWFICPHQQSTFTADGTHVQRSGTPVVGNLRKFPATYDEEAGTITIENVLSTSGVEELSEAPGEIFLDQNYPNPFNPTTLIRYGLPNVSRVRLTIHTLLGAQIAMPIDQVQEPGVYTYDFSAQDLPSGVYFYRLQTDMGTLTRRMTVAK